MQKIELRLLCTILPKNVMDSVGEAHADGIIPHEVTFVSSDESNERTRDESSVSS